MNSIIRLAKKMRSGAIEEHRGLLLKVFPELKDMKFTQKDIEKALRR